MLNWKHRPSTFFNESLIYFDVFKQFSFLRSCHLALLPSLLILFSAGVFMWNKLLNSCSCVHLCAASLSSSLDLSCYPHPNLPHIATLSHCYTSLTSLSSSFLFTFPYIYPLFPLFFPTLASFVLSSHLLSSPCILSQSSSLSSLPKPMPSFKVIPSRPHHLMAQ